MKSSHWRLLRRHLRIRRRRGSRRRRRRDALPGRRAARHHFDLLLLLRDVGCRHRGRAVRDVVDVCRHPQTPRNTHRNLFVKVVVSY